MVQARIKVAGVGGTGCRVVGRMMQEGVLAVELIAADTDWACVRAANAHCRVELRGVPAGLGAGGKAGWAAKTAEVCAGELRQAIGKCDLLFIVAGMGGGTGSGAASVVARLAREEGALTVGIVTMPLDLEGRRRGCVAQEGLNALRDVAGAVIVVPCEEVLEVTGRKVSIADFYAAVDGVLCEGIRSLNRLATVPGYTDIVPFSAGKHKK